VGLPWTVGLKGGAAVAKKRRKQRRNVARDLAEYARLRRIVNEAVTLARDLEFVTQREHIPFVAQEVKDRVLELHEIYGNQQDN
jgi:hypothetical protein